MEADNKNATIAIELTQKDRDIQQLYFEQFEQIKNIFRAAAGEGWTWRLHTTDDHGNMVSKIYTEKTGVSVFRKEDWPELISFFKVHILALDRFWSEAKYSFESLR